MKDIVSSHLEMQCLFMENKVNYFLEGEKILEDISKKGEKPRLLVHACCGPCATYPLVYLCPHFDVTILYNNSNIFPKEEHDKRYQVLVDLVGYYKKDYGFDIKVVLPPYENEEYMKDLEPYKDTPEGGQRCMVCYEKRLEQAFKYASENGYDYVTTVMTISRYKNAQVLNHLGQKLTDKYPNVKYFFSDFKKNRGQDYRNELVKKYNLYDQIYCGCVYSYNEMLERVKK